MAPSHGWVPQPETVRDPRLWFEMMTIMVAGRIPKADGVAVGASEMSERRQFPIERPVRANRTNFVASITSENNRYRDFLIGFIYRYCTEVDLI